MEKDTEYLAIPGHVSTQKAAKMLEVSDERIYQLIKAGKLPSRRVSGMFMIPVEAVEQFKRNQAGRTRTQAPAWRTYRNTSKMLGTAIEVRVRASQEKMLEKMLMAVADSQRHRLTGSVQRYILRDTKDATLISIWLVWKDSEMPDEAVQQQELDAFKAEFAEVLDWDTAVFSQKEGIVYT